ncbi:hypothetical protein PUN28_014135 [Cardiocondyla obscurior]|uniref:Uncharacterized protein n=1 Tax=Cardiocondyla obscurior TaxID=286306 RepID=A0AAW2F3W9_9HYME
MSTSARMYIVSFRSIHCRATIRCAAENSKGLRSTNRRGPYARKISTSNYKIKITFVYFNPLALGPVNYYASVCMYVSMCMRVYVYACTCTFANLTCKI